MEQLIERFSDEEYARRLSDVRERVQAEGLDGLIAYSTTKSQANVRYLSEYFVRFAGMQNREDGSYYMFGSTICLVDAGPAAPVVRTDQMWDRERCIDLSIYEDAQSTDDLGAFLGREVARRGYRRVGIDNWHLFPAWVYLEMQKHAPSTEFVPSVAVAETRRRKSPAELARIREACRVGVLAIQAGFSVASAGSSEFDMMVECEFAMRSRGDLHTNGESIGGCGPNTASGSHLPSRFNDRLMVDGEWVMLDVNPRVEGYCGDVSRHYAVGGAGAVSAELRRLHDACVDINHRVRAAVRPGVSGADLSMVADEVATEHGFGENRIGLLGHGIGIDIHDIPDFYFDRSPLSVGEVITIEPCLLIPRVAGVRIEDTIVVTEDGCEVLTDMPYALEG